MTPETEKYFRDLNSMFRSEGWLILLEDLNQSLENVNSIESTQNEQDLFFRKGQISVINNLLNLETQIENAQRAAEQEDQDDEDL